MIIGRPDLSVLMYCAHHHSGKIRHPEKRWMPDHTRHDKLFDICIRIYQKETSCPSGADHGFLSPILLLRSCVSKYKGFQRMLRCLTLDTMVARPPAVNGLYPVHLKPLRF